MMPAAVLLMFGELWLMDILIVSEKMPPTDEELVIQAKKASVVRNKKNE